MKLSELVKHLSHSSLMCARIDLAYWWAKYHHKIYDPPSAAMPRGLAVEHGCAHFHNGGEFDDPVEEAEKDFARRTALGFESDAKEREAANIAPMVAQYRTLWDGAPPQFEDYQRKVEVEVEGLSVPLIGYTDFEFEDSIWDLKTTTRMPSAIPMSHRHQGAIYQQAAGNRAIKFAYVTPKKAALYTLEDSTDDWNAVCQMALRLQNFVERFDTPEDLTASLIPNYDTFYWSSNQTKEEGKRLYGF